MREHMPYRWDLTPLGFVLYGVAGATAAWATWLWETTPAVWLIYFTMIAMDFLSGTLASAYEGKLSSQAAYRGAIRKALALLVAFGCELCGHGLEPHLGFEIPAGEMVAAAFTLQELISVIENAARAGVAIPGPVKKLLAAIHE